MEEAVGTVHTRGRDCFKGDGDQMATPVPEIMDGSLYLHLEQNEHC
jgi:hypothetical protein